MLYYTISTEFSEKHIIVTPTLEYYFKNYIFLKIEGNREKAEIDQCNKAPFAAVICCKLIIIAPLI